MGLLDKIFGNKKEIHLHLLNNQQMNEIEKYKNGPITSKFEPQDTDWVVVYDGYSVGENGILLAKGLYPGKGIHELVYLSIQNINSLYNNPKFATAVNEILSRRFNPNVSIDINTDPITWENIKFLNENQSIRNHYGGENDVPSQREKSRGEIAMEELHRMKQNK